MVIDLDAPVAVRPAKPRRGAREVLRPVVVLLVLVLGGSAAPPPRPQPVLEVDTTGTFTLTADAVFTSVLGRAPGRQAIIRRHPIGAGRADWAAEVPQTVGRMRVVGTVLVADPAEVLIATAADQQRTTFLDSATGRILWWAGTAGIVRVDGSGVLLAENGTLRRADLRTGRMVWSRSSSTRVLAGERVVVVDDTGAAAVLDPADGRVLATATPGAAPGDTARYDLAGDQLYLTRRVNGVWSLTAYRLADLRPLWRNTRTPPGQPRWCGPDHVCVTTAAGVTVLDRATGRERWSDDRWRTGLDSQTIGLPGPRRIAALDGRPGAGGALLDPATGAVTAMLGPVTFAGATILRADRERRGYTLLQRLTPTGDVRTVGALDPVVADRCAAAADLLACPTTEGQLRVWRLPY